MNHKGGVGKTTLTINIASALCELGKRVLIVDADPQCNVTSHFLDDTVVDDLLDQSETSAGRTLWSAVRPIIESEGDIHVIRPFDLYIEGLWLVPGDIRAAQFEEDLGEMWAQCFRRKSRGLRGTTAVSRLVAELEAKLRPDFVFYDTGPNIGALNRAVVLDCSHVITPVACDLFSLRAIKTLGHSLATWTKEWETIRQLAPEQEYVFPGKPIFLGYIPQSFRVYGDAIAKTSAAFASRMEKQVRTEIVGRLHPKSPPWSLRLGSVKRFGELVSKAQEEGCALWDVKGQSNAARDQIKGLFTIIANEVVRRTAGDR